MNIQHCMNGNVTIAAPAWTIRDAARMMKKIDAGFLPVGENDRLVGMVTDRDIAIRAVAEGKGPDTQLRDVMSKQVIYCFEDEDVAQVSAQMAEQKIRRMPVLSRAKRLVGVISLGDISQNGDANIEYGAETLSSISAPGGKHRQK
jgi:CBS domain-containing protein